MKKIKNSTVEIVGEDDLFSNVSRLIDESRKQVVKALNTAMVYTYYGIGKYIVEFEQGGNKRAEYGKGVLKRLSERLTERFGNGWSTDSLEKARTLFIVYSKSATVSRKSGDGTKNENSIPQFTLSWSHYLTLMRIENPQARDFYEIEAC